MVAIIAHLAKVYEMIFYRNLSTSPSIIFHNPEIPAPPVLHKVLDDVILSKFDNILIVGDLHGCFDEFLDIFNLASKTSKPNSRILKLFVGDLVNKGPKSKQVIEYFINEGKEDMLAVRGNHEERIVKQYMKYIKNKNTDLHECEWIKELDSEHIDFLISLPYTISIPKFNSIIVHAGLIPGKNIELNNWSDMTKIRNIIDTDYYDCEGLKGTPEDNIGDPWIECWRNSNLHVYFGHDAKRGLQLTEYATGLDTGCVYGNKLSAVLIDLETKKKQILEVKARKQYCPFNRPPP